MPFKDKVLGVDEYTDSIVVTGQCDILIYGLTSGTIKLQFKLQPSTELPSPDWWDFPNGTFSADAFQTVFVSGDGVKCRLLGVDNNAGVYVRIAKFLNT